jgi:hypothetical protein
MKLKLILTASAAFFALTLGAYAESVSSETNGVPGGTITTPGSESKGNPIPPATKSGEGSVLVITPEAPPTPEASAPTGLKAVTWLGFQGAAQVRGGTHE